MAITLENAITNNKYITESEVFCAITARKVCHAYVTGELDIIELLEWHDAIDRIDRLENVVRGNSVSEIEILATTCRSVLYGWSEYVCLG